MMAAQQSSFSGKGTPPLAPADFDETFVRIGRLSCETHYHAARVIIDAWLRQRGKQRLIAEREAFVKARDDERRDGLNRRDMGRILETAFPPKNEIDPTTAHLAAQHLRIRRNGGLAVSPMMSGGWMVGIRRVTAAELVDMAKARGFDPSLTGDGG